MRVLKLYWLSLEFIQIQIFPLITHSNENTIHESIKDSDFDLESSNNNTIMSAPRKYIYGPLSRANSSSWRTVLQP